MIEWWMIFTGIGASVMFFMTAAFNFDGALENMLLAILTSVATVILALIKVFN